jgi:hypothetical protein
MVFIELLLFINAVYQRRLSGRIPGVLNSVLIVRLIFGTKDPS